MSLFASNRDGGKTDQKGHHKPLGIYTGEVVKGLAVTQSSPIGMKVAIASGEGMIPTANDYKFYFWNDDALDVTISTANSTNPRRDFIVAYMDLGAATQTVTANNPGIPKAVAVAGTPATVPSNPTVSQIQTAIGVSNPYIILARVDVPAATSNISTGMVVDRRSWARLNLQGSPNGMIESTGSVGLGPVANSYFTVPGLVYPLTPSAASTIELRVGIQFSTPTAVATFSGRIMESVAGGAYTNISTGIVASSVQANQYGQVGFAVKRTLTADTPYVWVVEAWSSNGTGNAIQSSGSFLTYRTY